MKKLFLLILIGFLAACDQTVLELSPEMSNSDMEGPADGEGTEQEPLMFIQQRLFIDEWFTTTASNYVSFRILSQTDYRIYFKSDHEIRVIAEFNVRDNEPFKTYEAVVAAGQFLGKFPLSYIRSIDRLIVNGGDTAFNISGSEANVGVTYVVQNYNNNELLQELVEPLMLEESDAIEFDLAIWQERTNGFEPYEPFSELEPQQQAREAYFALNRREVGLLPFDEFVDLNQYLLIVQETMLPKGGVLLTSYDPPIMPNNMSLNIDMSRFYDVIPSDAASAFSSISYHGIKKRYYEKTELPPGCFNPSQCPNQAVWNPRYLWDVHQFTATFDDGEPIEFNVPSNTELERAEFIATEFAISYGRVTPLLRTGVKAVLIEDGRSNVWGGRYHGWGTTLTNCGECDVFAWDKLEELIMHELVHSSIDYTPQWFDHITGEVDRSSIGLITDEDWDRLAVSKDGFTMDEYSRQVPSEDRAQTLLFYAALRLYPESISDLTKLVIEQLIPNRIDVFDELLGFNRK